MKTGVEKLAIRRNASAEEKMENLLLDATQVTVTASQQQVRLFLSTLSCKRSLFII